jgi:hypothetical protein
MFLCFMGGGGAFDSGLGKREGGVKQTSAHPHISDRLGTVGWRQENYQRHSALALL